MKQVSSYVIIGAIVVGVLSGCGQQSKVGQVPDPSVEYPFAYGDVLVEGSISDPSILNPVLASDSASHDVTGLIFNSLLKYDKDLNLVGEAAESWEISPDGKIITFKIIKGIKWHDGNELTAADVQFTIGCYLDPKVKTAYRSNFENIKKIQVVDRYTFKVWYKNTFAPSLERMGGMPILPKHLLKDRDLNKADDFNTHPIGSGPYRFVEWKRAESVILQANSEYFEGRPYLNRVVFRIIPDKSVQFLELQNGGLDMITLTPNQYRDEGKTKEFEVQFNKYKYPSNQYTYLGFNLKKPMFKNKKFRQAIDTAIDKQALVDGILEGLGKVSTGPYTPNSWAYNYDVTPRKHDTLRARELFVQSGCRYGKDGMLHKDGKPVEFTILTNQGNRNREQAATIIQSQLKGVGVKVKIRIIAWSTFLSEFVNKRKFDVILMGWSLPQDPDNYSIFHSSKTGEHEFNFVSYNNPDVDKLLVNARQTFNQDKRKFMYNKIHKLIAEDLPYIFLFVPDSLPTVHKRILNIKPEAAGISYNFLKWYVPENFQKYTQ